DGSVHFALSLMALEWMDRVPDVPVPGFIGYMGSTPQAKEAFAAQADRDLTQFLACRARELPAGGKLLIAIPGRDAQRSASDGLYNVLNDAALDMVDAGKVSRSRFESFSMPIYFRSLQEMTSPMQIPASPVRDLGLRAGAGALVRDLGLRAGAGALVRD